MLRVFYNTEHFLKVLISFSQDSRDGKDLGNSLAKVSECGGWSEERKGQMGSGVKLLTLFQQDQYNIYLFT